MKMTTWQAVVVTAFPELFPGVLGASIFERARKKNIWDMEVVDMRAFSQDKRAAIDDKPFGGGAGMVVRADVVHGALRAHHIKGRKIFYPSPRGRLFTQDDAITLAHEEGATFLCGRYEGIDQRILDEWQIEEISIGDYILAGGEVATMVMLEAIVRLIPHVLGNADSIREESLREGLLEYPQYTSPRLFNKRAVPSVLLSGNHQAIASWRLKKSMELTQKRRKDLWKKRMG